MFRQVREINSHVQQLQFSDLAGGGKRVGGSPL